MAFTTKYMNNLKAQFHATTSNSKLGGKKEKMLAVGTAPGNGLFYLNNGTLVTDCVGTCGNVDCSGCGKRGICYAIDSFTQYEIVTINRVENTMMLRENPYKFFEAYNKSLEENKPDVSRYNESGEFETALEFDLLVDTCLMNEYIEFYAYTKNYDILRNYFSHGYELPNNLVILISIWGETGVKEYEEFKHHKNIKAFIVNNEKMAASLNAVQCPAYRYYNKHTKKGIKRIVVRVMEKYGFTKKQEECAKCGNCKLCTGYRDCKAIWSLEH